jgi:DNA transformation protein and related proteins
MDAERLKELFEPFGVVAVRRMFGGRGIYADGLFFALEIDGDVYLKADSESVSVFSAAGSAPFVYQGHTKPVTTNLWRLVDSVYDDPDAIRRWSALALQAARRAAQAKAGKTTPGKPKRAAARATAATKQT